MPKATSEMAYPLHWPDGQKRKSWTQRQDARFKVTLAQARDHLIAELARLGARHVVVSTDIPLRNDGLPYARFNRPADPGVCVYFAFEGDQHAFACDKWNRIEDNMRAIGKTIEAIRGISRWGSSDMMKRAVSAFKELPAQPDAEDWRRVLGLGPGSHMISRVHTRYRALARVHHADMGGNEQEMKRVNAAWEAAQKELR